MKELVRIATITKNNKSFKVVIEIKEGVNKEVSVEPYHHDNSVQQYLFIHSEGLKFDPQTLTIDCRGLSVPKVLLLIEVCNFVMQTNPELRHQ
jgi:hypothetical protein